jgi:hypothetical protein
LANDGLSEAAEELVGRAEGFTHSSYCGEGQSERQGMGQQSKQSEKERHAPNVCHRSSHSKQFHTKRRE